MLKWEWLLFDFAGLAWGIYELVSLNLHERRERGRQKPPGAER